MSQATDSHVAMMRAAIAMAWVDGSMHEDEKNQLKLFIEKNVNFSEVQKEVLLKDIEKQTSFDHLWEEIDDPQDRAHLINIALLLFQKDGRFCDIEKELLEKMEQSHMTTVDAATLQAEIHKAAEMARAQHKLDEAEFEKNLVLPQTRWLYYLEKKTGFPFL